jgi:Holliday junction resolvase RusA-like endonuclease
MTFDLPLPPSVNACFATDFKTKRRFASKAYTTWKKAAAQALASQYAAYGAPALHKPLALTIRLGLNYQSDIANREKPLTDLLVANLDMADDRYIERIVIERDQSVEGARVTIEGSYAGEARPIGEIIKPIIARLAEQVSHD